MTETHPLIQNLIHSLPSSLQDRSPLLFFCYSFRNPYITTRNKKPYQPWMALLEIQVQVQASSSARTPGSGFPSSNSKLAPPPVEMWLILSASPAFSTAATESPPPIMVVTPFPLRSASFLAIACNSRWIFLSTLHENNSDWEYQIILRRHRQRFLFSVNSSYQFKHCA